MPRLSADVLYEMLLEIKHNDPNHDFNSLDLLSIGDVTAQFQQLVEAGKVIAHHDIVGSFEVVG